MNKVRFDSTAFQERNGTCGMKLERSGRNLAEKSGTDRDLKWDEICSVLFRFSNWYGMFQPFRAKRNGIDNLDWDDFVVSVLMVNVTKYKVFVFFSQYVCMTQKTYYAFCLMVQYMAVILLWCFLLQLLPTLASIAW